MAFLFRRNFCATCNYKHAVNCAWINQLHYAIGIIPGPHEPQENINTYLKPLVDDLTNLWRGMLLIPASSIPVRAALLAVATDLPALRKITQFLGHKADLGCHICKIRALREPGTIGASGRMSYYTPSSCERR